jgi:hypothetical protein
MITCVVTSEGTLSSARLSATVVRVDFSDLAIEIA